MRVLGGLKYGASLLAIAGAMVTVTSQAHAGGFAVREQSAYYQGMSFAGAGTGDTLSSMYWNSAAAASAPGMNTETHISLIIPDSEITATGGAAIAPPAVGGLGLGTESGDIADGAVVPASYANYQVNDRLYLGIAMNSGFGLVTKPDNTDWAGSVIGITSDVFSLNVNPTVAYKLTPELTVGVGVQVEYLSIRLTNGPSPALPFGRQSEVDDIGLGFTAGATWTPRQGTTLGIGWRSAVDFDLEGDYNAPARLEGSASADLTLPDIVTIGLRFRVDELERDRRHPGECQHANRKRNAGNAPPRL
jgi:long-chain fatty acid transport protein